jgi:hypothetical protein
MSLAKPKVVAVVPLGANEDVSAVVIANETFLSKWASRLKPYTFKLGAEAASGRGVPRPSTATNPGDGQKGTS